MRNAQELILEETGHEMEVAVRVPEDLFDQLYREGHGPVAPYAYTKSFKLGGVTIMRKTAVIA